MDILIISIISGTIMGFLAEPIYNGMDKLMKGRTVFVIAHRLSTIQNSKAIMVMDKGRIIERGDHEALIKEKGRYYELYTGKVELD